ncbi:MAG: hypothetical protein V3S16_04515 [Candidatus Desulfatibia sp.]|uniref:hypothetical protein n=1 Tax=Candidatus Desulfatibia sp. TaxID=3101189 RepID=UPI002F2EA8F4
MGHGEMGSSGKYKSEEFMKKQHLVYIVAVTIFACSALAQPHFAYGGEGKFKESFKSTMKKLKSDIKKARNKVKDSSKKVDSGDPDENRKKPGKITKKIKDNILKTHRAIKKEIEDMDKEN